MKFKNALRFAKKGKKIKRPSWGGYWYWDKEKQTIMMHTKDGDLLDIRETQNVEYTLLNVIAEDWMIANENNTPILGGEALFDFSEALTYLKRGFKMARKNWNAKEQYIYLFKPYENEHFDITERENAPGTMYAFLVIKTNYNGIVPWLASQTDLLADDWHFVD